MYWGVSKGIGLGEAYGDGTCRLGIGLKVPGVRYIGAVSNWGTFGFGFLAFVP